MADDLRYSSDTNGHGNTAVVPLRETQDFSQLEALVRCYEVLRQRDGKAEAKAWWWQCIALALVGVVVIVSILDHLNPRKVPDPFIQVVQVDDEQRVMMIGYPTRLQDYQPHDKEWEEMIGEWIRIVRWRGKDEVVAQIDYDWAYLHTCGDATKLLKEYEKQEKPFELGKKTVQVEIKNFNKTPGTNTYTVLWKETKIEPGAAPKIESYSGVFSTGRWTPTTQADLIRNNRGLCITAYNIRPQAL
jgi:type IV secretory pathway TrbF-like protein